MNEELIGNYSFAPSTKTVVFTDYTTIYLERLVSIINVTKNIVLYDRDIPTLTATVATNVVTLGYDTTAGNFAAGDKLAIQYVPLAADVVYGNAPTPTAMTNLDNNIGAKANTAATTDTGTFSLISLFKRLLTKFSSDVNNRILVHPTNVPAATNLTTTANRITTNATTTPTAATCYISAIVILAEVAGTASTVVIRDKSGTPKVVVNGFSTATAGTSPTVIQLPTPILMTGGIDIVTAGAAAATVGVWINYYQ